MVELMVEVVAVEIDVVVAVSDIEETSVLVGDAVLVVDPGPEEAIPVLIAVVEVIAEELGKITCTSPLNPFMLSRLTTETTLLDTPLYDPV